MNLEVRGEVRNNIIYFRVVGLEVGFIAVALNELSEEQSVGKVSGLRPGAL